MDANIQSIVIKKNPKVIARAEEEGKYLVYDPVRGAPLVMNKTSHFIWDLCDGTRDVKTIQEAVLKAYVIEGSGVDINDIDRIIVEHLTLLKAVGLLIES
jgi:hypothetical protein